MAPSVYPLWKQSLERGDANADLDNDTATDGVYCALVNTSIYTYSDSHQFYTSLSGIIGTDQRIIGPVVNALGVFDGGDVAYPNVTGTFVTALVLYRRNSGPSSTWRLVYYYDTPGGGLPFVPSGGNVFVLWSPQGIFRL
jgi:hypothetical protein